MFECVYVGSSTVKCQIHLLLTSVVIHSSHSSQAVVSAQESLLQPAYLTHLSIVFLFTFCSHVLCDVFIAGLSQTSSQQTSNWLQKGGDFATVKSQALFCLGSLSGLQSGLRRHDAKCFWGLLLLDGLLGALCCFSSSPQEAEWHCDEFTKGACFSRGKSEVSLSDA